MLSTDEESGLGSDEPLSMSDGEGEANDPAMQKCIMTWHFLNNLVHMISHVIVTNQLTFAKYS